MTHSNQPHTSTTRHITTMNSGGVWHTPKRKFCPGCGVRCALKDPHCRSCGRPFHPDAKQPIYEHEMHPGNNAFPCHGRFVTGRGGFAWFTWAVLLVTYGLYLGNNAPFLWRNVSPAIVIVSNLLFLSAAVSLFRTQFSDPGIIPRGCQDEIQVPGEDLMSHLDIMVNGRRVRLRYCSTCENYRPPRSTHCSICNNCIEGFDHHCPWVGNCVGARNYRYFAQFVSSLWFLIALVLASTIYNIVVLSKDHKQIFRATPISFIVAVVCGCFFFPLLALTVTHAYFLFANITTNETMKSRFEGNPYYRGFFSNFCYRCFGPRLPSQLHSTELLGPNLQPFNRPLKKQKYTDANGNTVTTTTSTAASYPPPPPTTEVRHRTQSPQPSELGSVTTVVEMMSQVEDGDVSVVLEDEVDSEGSSRISRHQQLEGTSESRNDDEDDEDDDDACALASSEQELDQGTTQQQQTNDGTSSSKSGGLERGVVADHDVVVISPVTNPHKTQRRSSVGSSDRGRLKTSINADDDDDVNSPLLK